MQEKSDGMNQGPIGWIQEPDPTSEELVLSFRKGFPDSSVGKEFACNAGDPNSIPGFGRSAGEGIGYLLQYSGLERSMDYHKESDMNKQLSLSGAQ